MACLALSRRPHPPPGGRITPGAAALLDQPAAHALLARLLTTRCAELLALLNAHPPRPPHA